MIGHLEDKLAAAGRRTAIGAVGVTLISAGAALLTLSLWIVLAQAYGAATASLIIGAAFSGIGLIILGLVASRPAPEPAPASKETPPKDATTAAIEAFFVGLTTAMKVRQRG